VSDGGIARLLVVEDDRTTADLVALYLRHAGYEVHVEHAGDRAIARLAEAAYDLLVLDVMLPGADGLEICRRVRERDGTGIILLTARTSEEERVRGLELGADDYVPKPFSPRELVARVGAVLRRRPPGSAHLLRRGELTINRAAHTVTVEGRMVDLTPSEFALLEALASRPGHVRTRAQLLDVLPGDRPESLERTVDVHVRNLRRKLEVDPSAPRYVQTVLGAGYRFAPDRGPT
jgi:two-component system, OmpR family, response regulator MtrA